MQAGIINHMMHATDFTSSGMLVENEQRYNIKLVDDVAGGSETAEGIKTKSSVSP